TAPGTWPATGSIGSVLPAKRSGARASSKRQPALSFSVTSSVESHASRSGRATNLVAVRFGSSVVVGRSASFHARRPPSSTATASCPIHLRSHHKRAAKAPVSASYAITCDDRSEEHTSELQSRENLVCRL